MLCSNHVRQQLSRLGRQVVQFVEARHQCGPGVCPTMVALYDHSVVTRRLQRLAQHTAPVPRQHQLQSVCRMSTSSRSSSSSHDDNEGALSASGASDDDDDDGGDEMKRRHAARAKVEQGVIRVPAGRDGAAICCSWYGDSTARPVLFLHGGGQTRHSWETTGAGRFESR